MDFNQHSTSSTKRTRYYSQTLETNVTISFDCLKSLKAVPETPPPPLQSIASKFLDTEDSCHDSTQDSAAELTSTKQRKKLRKTLEDIKKSQKSLTDSDSDDDGGNRGDCDDCCLKDYDEGNDEFLGFAEKEEETLFKCSSKSPKKRHDNEQDQEPKTRGGTMKNWLTTGKAIAPTLDDAETMQRIRRNNEDVLLENSPSSSSAVILGPLKKRWDFAVQSHEETDITDDNSPADDEDKSVVQSRTTKTTRSHKRGLKIVIDSDKELLGGKKVKLDAAVEKQMLEHSFIKPHHLRCITKNSDTESHCREENQLTRKPQLRVKNFKDILKVRETEDLNGNPGNDSDSQVVKKSTTRRLRGLTRELEELTETSGTDTDCHEGREGMLLERQKTHSVKSKVETVQLEQLKLLDMEELIEKANSEQVVKETKTWRSRNPKSPHCDKKSQGKNDSEMDCKAETPNPDDGQKVTEGRESKRLRSKNKSEDDKIDKSFVKSQKMDNSEHDVTTIENSKHSKSKPSNKNDVKNPQDVSGKHKPETPKLKLKSVKNSYKKLDRNATDVVANKNEINAEEQQVSETLKPMAETSQTSKRKRGGKTAKVKHEETVNTATRNERLKDIATTSLKRRLTLDSSENEGPSTSSKLRSTKSQSRKKFKIEDSNNDSSKTPQKNSNENDTLLNNLESIATPRLALIKNETPASSVGRKRKYNTTESNFNSRLLLITKREQLVTDDILTDSKVGSGPIQCGLCLARTTATKWIQHLAEHYGVGWKVGEEKMNIESRSVVLNHIMAYLKGSKGLPCRMCKKQYRSALGLLQHIESCGEQAQRVVCDYCKKDYAKLSFPIHLRSCNVKFAQENGIVNDQQEDNEVQKEEVVFSNTGRLKRNSTLKAESKLKVLGAELEKVRDKTDSLDFDPKSRIRYVPPLEGNFTQIWTQDIEKLGKASCPKEKCKFTSHELEELEKHLKKCKFIQSGYFCNFCRRRVSKTEKEAIKHVTQRHQGGRTRNKSDDSDCNLKTDDEQSSDDYDLSEGVDEDELDDDVEEDDDLVDEKYDDKRKQKNKKPISRNINQSMTITSRKPVFDRRVPDVNKKVLKKWKSFLASNYSSEPLYNEFTPQYSVKNLQDFNKYLPTQTVSMKFNFKRQEKLITKVGKPDGNIEWSELKRHESIYNKRDTFYFLGAPVKLCCWLPLPANVSEQYMAVVYRQDVSKFIKFSQPKPQCTVILIMKVTQNSNNKVELKVHYGFIVHDGPIHHVSFLPSGGYDKNSNRLGLVAVATINSYIKVYSLPLNVEAATAATSQETNSNNNEDIRLIEVKPSFLLCVDIMDQKQNEQHVLLNPQCLQICWSEFSGHQHVFASYSNGFIAIWDITNDLQQNLNRFEIDEIINYVPLNYFYAGEKAVKCIALHYDTCGPRWLGVSGVYRKFIIYDIKCFLQPIVMKDDINKNIFTSMDWCPLWETILYSYCDTFPNNGRCVTIVNPTNIMFTQTKLDYMTCGVTQIHYSPVSNMCVAASNSGDLVLLDNKELHFECPLTRKFGDRRMLYAMDVKQLNGEPLVELPKGNQKNAKIPSNWHMHDDEYKSKYGLVFEPLLKLKDDDKKKYLSEDRGPPTNILSLMRVNTLRCNLNLNAKNLIALGYENGFLRLVNFNKDVIFK